MAGFSDVVENKLLDHITGKTAYTITAPTYLALTTVAVAETDTGTTLGSLTKEATYGSYVRKSIAAADMAAAAAGSTSNTVQQTFANCTSGSNTIIGWALLTTSSGAGDILMFGTCTSTVISTTQTPPTVAVGALTLTLD